MQPLDYVAELSKVAGILGVKPSTGWTERLAAFEPWLAGYLEYQIKLDEPALSVVTLGKEPHFLERVAEQLLESGASRPVLDAFHELQARVSRATWGLKLSLADPTDVQVYIKKPVPVAAVAGWLRAREVPVESVVLLEQVSADLGKAHTHFVGLDATSEEALPLQIYFTQYSDDVPAVQARVLQVARCLGLNEAAGEQIQASMQRLVGRRRTLWVSLTLVGERFLPTLKLDFSSPPRAEVLRLFSPSGQATLQLLAQTIRAGSPDYVGLRFANDTQPRPGLYITRRR